MMMMFQEQVVPHHVEKSYVDIDVVVFYIYLLLLLLCWPCSSTSSSIARPTVIQCFIFIR
jgi:hypothetical protein